MRVVALLAIRNEELYLRRCLRHLHEQGVETCIIDNGSTDATLDIAQEHRSAGVFRIDRIPYTGVYEWRRLLMYKSQLAQEIDADWFIHHDADEIREAPTGFATLVDGIRFADANNYNAIDFDEFVFVPTGIDERYEGTDYVDSMRFYYYYFPPRPNRLNAWKKTSAAVDLASSAGHRIDFEGIRIFPDRFTLRHYIMLSREHAARKYGRRVYALDEVRMGWHRVRVAFTPDRLRFPKSEQLKEYHGDDRWDRSDPWKSHKYLYVMPPDAG